MAIVYVLACIGVLSIVATVWFFVFFEEEDIRPIINLYDDEYPPVTSIIDITDGLHGDMEDASSRTEKVKARMAAAQSGNPVTLEITK